MEKERTRTTMGSGILFWALLNIAGALLLLGWTSLWPSTAAGDPPVNAGTGERLSPAPALPASAPQREIGKTAHLQRHQVVATIPLTAGIGQEPVVIAADPNSGLVYVANDGSHDITVLSGTQVLDMVAGAAEGEGMHYVEIGVHPATGLLYAIEEGENRCLGSVRENNLQILSATEVVTTTPLMACSVLHGGGCGVSDMAFQPTNGYLYLLEWFRPVGETPPVSGFVKLVQGTEVITTISLSFAQPRSVAADPHQGWVYITADYTDVVFVLSDTAIVGTVPLTQAGQVVVQPQTGLAYVQREGNPLAILQGTAHVGDLAIGPIEEMDVDPTQAYLYASHPFSPVVTIVSGTAVLTEVAVISPAGRIAANSTTGLVYLRHPDEPVVTVLSGTAVLTQVAVLGGDAAIAAAPVTGLVYAVDGENTVAVLQGSERLTTLPPAFPQPRAMALHPHTGQIVLLGDPPTLAFIEEEMIVATAPLSATPAQIVIHPDTGLIYLTLPEQKGVLVLSGTTPLATVPVSGTINDIAVQPSNGLLYIPDDRGTLNVLSSTKRIAALSLSVSPLAHVAADAERALVYVSAPGENAVYVLTGTTVLTTVQVGAYPDEIALVPHEGTVYVAGETVAVLSATEVITSFDLPGSVQGMRASIGGYLYLNLFSGGPYEQCTNIAVVRGTELLTLWRFAYDPYQYGTRLSAMEPHRSLNYLYAGHAIYGSRLSIGVGATLAQTLTVGDGSWVRAITVDQQGERVYVATDHAITILEVDVPYRFYLPLMFRGLSASGPVVSPTSATDCDTDRQADLFPLPLSQGCPCPRP